MARRALPVKAKGQRGPASLRAQLFLTHIVSPATTALADTATHDQHVDQAAVVHVHVVPVIHTGTDDDHATSVGFVSVVGKLTGNTGALLCRHASNFLLPRGGIRTNLIKRGRAVIFAVTGKATVDAVVGTHQIKNGNRQHVAAIRPLQALGGQVVEQQVISRANTRPFDVLKVLVLNTAKVRERHARDAIVVLG